MDYPFEIHVTVRGANIERFRTFCGAIGVKPIILDLQDRTGTTVLTDVMTSFRLMGTTESAMDDAANTAFMLGNAGFQVVRAKIESSPEHPDAKRCDDGFPMPVGSYFECHIQVTTPEDRLPDLRLISGVHVSRNVFKRALNDMVVVMLTKRAYEGTAAAFQASVDSVCACLASRNFEVGKVEVEFCVFDTNQDHDKEWISQG